VTRFGHRLQVVLAERGQLCVGIDPHASLLSDWGLEVTASGAREFGLRVVEAAAGRVGVVKPQVAFFERFGAAGFAALEDVLAAARAAGLITIADAKRGDIGSTMDAYAAAWLTPGAPLEVDAVTVSPYLGPDSLADTFRFALDAGKGVFVLAATSNPEAADLQRAELIHERAESPGAARTVPAYVAGRVTGFGDAHEPGAEVKSVGLVIGATIERDSFGLDDDTFATLPILAPGFGAQGARLSRLPELFGRLSPHVLASASRSVLGAGPDGIVAAIETHSRELREARA